MSVLADLALGKFMQGDSVIHRLDPRTKIMVTMMAVVGIFLVNDFKPYLVIAAIMAGGIRLARISPLFLLKGLRPLVFIIIMTMVFNFFLTPGRPILAVGPFSITDAGIYRGLLLAARLFLLIVGTSLLTATTSPISLTHGLEDLLRPFAPLGLPAQDLAMMLGIALRFIPVFGEEMDKLIKAQVARGADFTAGNLLQRIKQLPPLLVPLFLNAFRRADDLALAMEARCYHGSSKRSRMRELRMGSTDYAILGVTTALLLVAIMTRVPGW